jgi:uncharacterized protein (DUF169 family)
MIASMRTDYAALNATLLAGTGLLRLVAVSFLSSPPDGVERFAGTVPSGCSFWSLAAQGRSFYTLPADHLNCPIGAFTHAIDLPPARAAELEQTLSLMSSIGYVRLEEVPSIPRLSNQPAVTYYAPLENAIADPDVVIAAGRPRPLMRLQEAAVRAGAASQLPLLGRPTCMALPAAMAHGSVMSAGCIGNRVYTSLGDDELYLMLPGKDLANIAGQLGVIAAANDTLAEYHLARRQALTS